MTPATEIRGARVRVALGPRKFFTKDLLERIDGNLGPRLNRFGAKVRLRAKSRIRRPRQKTEAEMTLREKIRYEKLKNNELEIGRKIGRPFVVSKPGDYPFSHSRKLPESIYYAYDESTKSIWTGPIAFDTRPGEASGALEKGGVSWGKFVAARPYMRPSFEQIIAEETDNVFRGILRKSAS